jgi:hypothetical protein
MDLKDRKEYIRKLENNECVCHEVPKGRPTCKIENGEKWCLSVMVFV